MGENIATNKKAFFDAVKKLPTYNSFGSNADVHVADMYKNMISEKKPHETAMMCALGYASNIIDEEMQENEDGCDLKAMRKTKASIRELGNKIFGHSQW